ncbi:deoxycytidyl transferase, partial [Cladochytrium tenue]
MHQRFRKNQEANRATQAASRASSVFEGVVFYFDGYLGARTMLEWKALVLSHSAIVIDMLTPDITHIVADNLTDRKVELWKNKKVVLSKWIEDSIAAGKPPADDRQSDEATTKAAGAPALRSTSEGFLSSYYASSRLSRISNWRNDLRDMVVAELARRGKGGRNNNRIGGDRTILHVDMDCFFASVAVAARPELAGRPVAVTHAAAARRGSTAEVASCNYAARAAGVRNGMFVGRAAELCPDLAVAPYDFEAYDTAARTLYGVLLDTADDVVAVSCDEAFVDVGSRVRAAAAAASGGPGDDVRLAAARAAAEEIRAAVLARTGCTASVGIGSSMLTARVATRRAKPNGVAALLGGEDEVAAAFEELPAADLPGVGRNAADRLRGLGVTTCGELAGLGRAACQREFGPANGLRLWEFSRGIDRRPLENKARQSVGAEVNWGVRFETDDQ